MIDILQGAAFAKQGSRAPTIIDETLYAARLTGSDGDTIATLVNWGNHPEALSDENTLITSDYVHYVREAVEGGVHYDSYDIDGLGGVCIYLSAAVGGLMTPLGIQVTDGNGDTYGDSNWDNPRRLLLIPMSCAWRWGMLMTISNFENILNQMLNWIYFFFFFFKNVRKIVVVD